MSTHGIDHHRVDVQWIHLHFHQFPLSALFVGATFQHQPLECTARDPWRSSAASSQLLGWSTGLSWSKVLMLGHQLFQQRRLFPRVQIASLSFHSNRSWRRKTQGASAKSFLPTFFDRSGFAVLERAECRLVGQQFAVQNGAFWQHIHECTEFWKALRDELFPRDQKRAVPHARSVAPGCRPICAPQVVYRSKCRNLFGEAREG